MFDWFVRRRWLVTVGDVGWWHGRRNYPDEQHGIGVMLYQDTEIPHANPGDSVPALRIVGETNHG